MKILIAALALALAGCGAPSSFQGIGFAAGAASTEIQTLAQRAAAGDKWAQLELGIRFEEGRGVPVSWDRAARLYRMAAETTGGTIMVYVPPVTPGRTGRVMPLSSGPRMVGLAQARDRLEALRKRRRAGAEPRRI
jgi:hypothetical protein